MELQSSSSHGDSTSDSELSDRESTGTAPNVPTLADPIYSQLPSITSVDCGDRWQVYFRLQELDIPCQCKSYQPLVVDIQSAQSLIQVWSVVKRISTPRNVLSEWLNQCLRLPSPQLDT